jgi:hypothetical protein
LKADEQKVIAKRGEPAYSTAKTPEAVSSEPFFGSNLITENNHELNLWLSAEDAN